MWKNVLPNKAAEYLAAFGILYADSMQQNNGHFFAKLKDFLYEVPSFIPAKVFPKPGDSPQEQDFYNKLIKPFEEGSAYTLSFLQGKVLHQKPYQDVFLEQIHSQGITITHHQLLQVLRIFFIAPGQLSERMLASRAVSGKYIFEFFLNKDKYIAIVESKEGGNGLLDQKFYLFDDDPKMKFEGPIIYAYIDFLRKS